jgi:hypothetical protein
MTNAWLHGVKGKPERIRRSNELINTRIDAGFLVDSTPIKQKNNRKG